MNNDKPQVIIMGMRGYLGSFLRRAMSVKYHVTAFGEEGDRLSNFPRHPVAVINCAKFGSVQDYEREPERALGSMMSSVQLGQEWASLYQALYVQLSTSYVFSGSSEIAYTESDTPLPINHFGSVSLQCERLAAEYQASLILRTSGLYGAYSHRPNWDLWGLERMIAHQSVEAWWNDLTTPTFIHDMARVLDAAIDRHVRGSTLTGLFHVAGPTHISRFGFFACSSNASPVAPAQSFPPSTIHHCDLETAACPVAQSKTISDWNSTMSMMDCN